MLLKTSWTSCAFVESDLKLVDKHVWKRLAEWAAHLEMKYEFVCFSILTIVYLCLNPLRGFGKTMKTILLDLFTQGGEENINYGKRRID